MKIAYLTSLYPAPSHTFIEREIRELCNTGLEVVRFSVRTPAPEEILGVVAQAEAAITRSLVPSSPFTLLSALFWALRTRPRALALAFRDAAFQPGGAQQKLKWLAYFGEAMVLAWWLYHDGVSHLHCHFGNSGSNVALIAARLARVPFSITFHGIDLNDHLLFRHREKLVEAKFCATVTDYGKALMTGVHGEALGQKISVVRCAVSPLDLAEITPLPQTNSIVCVARLSQEKGHSVLLEALRILKARGVPFHCTLVGGGPLETMIQASIVDLGLSSNVAMVGAQSPEAVTNFISRSDVLVLTSLAEGLPVVIMEAFAQNRPVVASDVGGISELVFDGVNGRILRSGDAVGFADAIEYVFADKDRAAKMGMCGRETLKVKHDPQVSAMQLRELFTGKAVSDSTIARNGSDDCRREDQPDTNQSSLTWGSVRR